MCSLEKSVEFGCINRDNMSCSISKFATIPGYSVYSPYGETTKDMFGGSSNNDEWKQSFYH